MLAEKYCKKCHKTRPVGEFPKDRSQKDGLYLYCRGCRRRLYEVDRDRCLKRQRAYDRRNWIKRAAAAELRASRIASAPGGQFVKERYRGRVVLYGGVCAYCSVAKATTLDHGIPVSRGGSNWPSNIYPACLSCNSSKGPKKLHTEWIPPNRRRPQTS